MELNDVYQITIHIAFAARFAIRPCICHFGVQLFQNILHMSYESHWRSLQAFCYNVAAGSFILVLWSRWQERRNQELFVPPIKRHMKKMLEAPSRAFQHPPATFPAVRRTLRAQGVRSLHIAWGAWFGCVRCPPPG